MSAHIRHRSFCRFCGHLTTYTDSCCAAHRDLLALDELPPDEVESLPVMAQDAELELEDAQATRERERR